ncbi:U3 snoRNP protein [Coemansia sp. RSA 2703]|nr:U3 snoRNP protein [Coemansia sp. RSA 2703]KAJ2378211.1 U3 snoRNP protein [Coemansia sp. RSA 2607]KAJ2398147.1 U3 snoRNP protein [Coemansia sp. RSA 2603]
MTAQKASKGLQPVEDAFSQTIPESFIDQYINRPGAFVVPNTEARDAAMEVVGKTYDAANFSDKFGLFDDWKAVTDSGFDSSLQLWELINIRNQPVLKYTTDIMKELSALVDSVNIGSGSESGSDEEDGDENMLSQSDSASEAEESDGSEDDQDESEDGVDLAEESDIENSAGSFEEAEDIQGEDEDEEDEEDDDDIGAPSKRSVIDDDFFSLAEMERFADEAEEEDMRDRAILAGDYPKPKPGEEDEESDDSDEDDDEDIDLFQNFDDDDDDDMDDGEGDVKADEMKYSDFFKAPKGSKRGLAKASREKHVKKVKFDANLSDSDDQEDETEDVPKTRKSNLFDDGEDDEEVSDGEQKSEFEKRQEKLQNLINKLEDEAVEKKDWAMTGEVSSGSRPKNSLLAEDLEFDHVQKPVPVITQEVTQTLEDVIKQRILNEEWDDVERKKDIQQKPFKPSAFVELDDKKSKKSLAEVYEEQYVAEKSGDAYVPEDDAKVTEAHKAVDNQFRNLFAQLDALSHFHFAPRPAVADIEIRTSAPALQMEEKLPVNMSHAEQLAPEEIYEKNQGRNGRTGDLMGETELTREERKRRRNKKKNAQRKMKADKPAAAKSSTNVKTGTPKDKSTAKV